MNAQFAEERIENNANKMAFSFKNRKIEEFYSKNLGHTPNSFIQTNSMCLDFNSVISTLLHFLDAHDNTTIYLACRGEIAFSPSDKGVWHKTTLINYVLDLTQKTIDKNKLSEYELSVNWYGNFRLIYGGISALATHVCLAFGEEYINKFNNDTFQASLAIIDNMPVITQLHCLDQITEIMKIYYIYSRQTRTYDNIYMYKANNSIVNIVKTMLDANMLAIRDLIFKSIDTPNNFISYGWGALWQEKAKTVIEQSEAERKEFFAENQIEDILGKNHAYIKENEGLRRNNSKLQSERQILTKIVKAYEKNDSAAAKEAQKELKHYRKQTA